MHWGHSTTKDFIVWKQEPVALAPDTPADCGGCFSGTAVDVDGKQVIVFGEMAPALTRGIRLKTPIFGALVEFDWLRQVKTPVVKFRPLPQFPATTRDITLVAATSLSIQEIAKTARQLGGKLLEKVELVDIFEDEKVLGAGKRSVSLQFTYRDAAQTLTDEKANKEHDRLRNVLPQKLPIELR